MTERGSTIIAVPQDILYLVERFDRNIESYRSGQYNEAQARKEFIDPLFKCLGWDMDNADPAESLRQWDTRIWAAPRGLVARPVL